MILVLAAAAATNNGSILDLSKPIGVHILIQAMEWERQRIEAEMQRRRLEEEAQLTAKAHMLEKMRLEEESKELERQRQQAEQLVEMEKQRKLLETEAIERFVLVREGWWPHYCVKSRAN